jgi:hypothetical protein
MLVPPKPLEIDNEFVPDINFQPHKAPVTHSEFLYQLLIDGIIQLTGMTLLFPDDKLTLTFHFWRFDHQEKKQSTI